MTTKNRASNHVQKFYGDLYKVFMSLQFMPVKAAILARIWERFKDSDISLTDVSVENIERWYYLSKVPLPADCSSDAIDTIYSCLQTDLQKVKEKATTKQLEESWRKLAGRRKSSPTSGN